MDINDELITQWEPKVQRMASNVYIVGLDRDDLAQELRLAIVKAAQGFEEDRGVLFHTYLHTAMTNTIRTLMTKSQRHPQTVSADKTYVNLGNSESQLRQPSEIIEAFTDSTDFTVDVNFSDSIRNCGLSEQEYMFINLRLEGLTMSEISYDLGESAYKLRQSVRDKLAGELTNEKTT